jgi:hypothetical protein
VPSGKKASVKYHEMQLAWENFKGPTLLEKNHRFTGWRLILWQILCMVMHIGERSSRRVLKHLTFIKLNNTNDAAFSDNHIKLYQFQMWIPSHWILCTF